MNILKKVPLAIAALLLVGCKVEIKVPEGGHVEGWALSGCGEAQTCIIDIDHRWFYEQFTAMPSDTHKFAGWKKGDGYFCGRKEAECELSTFAFAKASLQALLADSDRIFYLEPLFVPKSEDYQNRISPDLRVTVNISQDGQKKPRFSEMATGEAAPRVIHPCGLGGSLIYTTGNQGA